MNKLNVYKIQIKSIQKNYISNNLKDVKRKIYRILIQYFRKRNANF